MEPEKSCWATVWQGQTESEKGEKASKASRDSSSRRLHAQIVSGRAPTCVFDKFEQTFDAAHLLKKYVFQSYNVGTIPSGLRWAERQPWSVSILINR